MTVSRKDDNLIIFIHQTAVAKEDKNSSGDEIANVNFCTTTTYM